MIIVRIDKKYYRPNEVPNLIGDATKAKKLLNWKSKTNINQLIEEMLFSDIEKTRKSILK